MKLERRRNYFLFGGPWVSKQKHLFTVKKIGFYTKWSADNICQQEQTRHKSSENTHKKPAGMDWAFITWSCRSCAHSCPKKL